MQQITFIEKTNKIKLKFFEIIKNNFLMYLERKKMVGKSFSMFNGPAQNIIEHTKPFPNQMYYYFVSTYMNNVFFIIHRFFKPNFVSFE